MTGTDAGGQDASPKGGSDPERMVAEIERTREELAETLDAIAEKVSPKRVAKRTTKKVAAAVKETAHDAATTVKDTAASAKDKVTGGATKADHELVPDPGPAVPTVESRPLAAAPYVPPPLSAASTGPKVKPLYVAAGAVVALVVWRLLRRRG